MGTSYKFIPGDMSPTSLSTCFRTYFVTLRLLVIVPRQRALSPPRVHTLAGFLSPTSVPDGVADFHSRQVHIDGWFHCEENELIILIQSDGIWIEDTSGTACHLKIDYFSTNAMARLEHNNRKCTQ